MERPQAGAGLERSTNQFRPHSHMSVIITCSGKMKLAIAAAVCLFFIASYVLIADAKKGPMVTDIVSYLLSS